MFRWVDNESDHVLPVNSNKHTFKRAPFNQSKAWIDGDYVTLTNNDDEGISYLDALGHEHYISKDDIE